ncbi:hypothetical protein TRAPUB_6148 [Trametes pubescens]|uniref:Uncharacterized protein n=1 Tax=Trametes pubescens TaxID=154538 RepID=A0A1M2V6M0_TRAPU|nr:hypothetical protein TRAPUB_6148 [Trametes pubescens]
MNGARGTDSEPVPPAASVSKSSSGGSTSLDNLVASDDVKRTPDRATVLADRKGTEEGTLHIVQLVTSAFNNVRALHAQLVPILDSTALDCLINNASMVRPSPPRSPALAQPAMIASLNHPHFARRMQSVHGTAFDFDSKSIPTVLRKTTIGPALV